MNPQFQLYRAFHKLLAHSSDFVPLCVTVLVHSQFTHIIVFGLLNPLYTTCPAPNDKQLLTGW